MLDSASLRQSAQCQLVCHVTESARSVVERTRKGHHAQGQKQILLAFWQVQPRNISRTQKLLKQWRLHTFCSSINKKNIALGTAVSYKTMCSHCIVKIARKGLKFTQLQMYTYRVTAKWTTNDQGC